MLNFNKGVDDPKEVIIQLSTKGSEEGNQNTNALLHNLRLQNNMDGSWFLKPLIENRIMLNTPKVRLVDGKISVP